MPERDPQAIARTVARDEIRDYSITALGYDPDDDKEPRPREAIEWLRQHRRSTEARQKYLGAFLVAVVTTAASILVSSTWPVIVSLFRGR